MRTVTGPRLLRGLTATTTPFVARLRADRARPNPLSGTLCPTVNSFAGMCSSYTGDRRPDNRLRGRRGVAQRLRRLAAEPLCRDCKAKGRDTPATVPDHIVPLGKG